MAPTTARTMLQSEKPFRPAPVIMLPRKPPRNAPTIPISIVTIIPPGSRPGISALAIAPATSPSTIQARMVISVFLRGVGLHTPGKATSVPSSGSGTGDEGLGSSAVRASFARPGDVRGRVMLRLAAPSPRPQPLQLSDSIHEEEALGK